MVLLIDNYDSFVHNLARYLRRLGVEVDILRNDSNLLAERACEASAIVISPGPCGPEQAGDCIRLVQEWSGLVPILGVCLGHQVICQAFGGDIVRANRPIHGMALPIKLYPSRLFEGIKPVTRFARYHSLIVDPLTLPKCLSVIAESLPEDDSGMPLEITEPKEAAWKACCENTERVAEIMAVEHSQHQTFGVQFHPESILSADGYKLLSNFLKLSGIAHEQQLPESDLNTANKV